MQERRENNPLSLCVARIFAVSLAILLLCGLSDCSLVSGLGRRRVSDTLSADL